MRRVNHPVLKGSGARKPPPLSHQQIRVPDSLSLTQDTAFRVSNGRLVRAVIPRGKHAGVRTGRATVKASGQILSMTDTGVHPTTSYQHCRVLQHGHGWRTRQKRVSEERSEGGFLPDRKAAVSTADYDERIRASDRVLG